MPGNDGASAALLSSSPPATSPTNNGKHRCSRCPANFKRLEHLKRHQLGHGDQRRFACPMCPKRFTRSDILNRHVLVHRVQEPRELSIKRACLECARVRERCTKATPCQRCHSKSIRCVYPTERPKPNPTPADNLVAPPANLTPGLDYLNHGSDNEPSGSQSWPKETLNDCRVALETTRVPPSPNLQQAWPPFSNATDGVDSNQRGAENTTTFQWLSGDLRTDPGPSSDEIDARTTLDVARNSNTASIRDASDRAVVSSFSYGNLDCSIQSLNVAPLMGPATRSSPQINATALGYSSEAYDMSFEFPLNWLPANESPDLDYSYIPRFGFNSPELFKEPATSQVLEDSNMTDNPNDMVQPINNPAGNVDLTNAPNVPAVENWQQREDMSDTSTPLSTSSPPVTISTMAQDLKKSSLPSSVMGGFYSTSTNGARMPCTTRAKRPSTVIFGATALTVVSHDVPEFDADLEDISFPSLSHVSYNFLPSEGRYDHLRPATYNLISTRFKQLCQDCSAIYPAFSSAEFPSIDHLNFFAKLYFQHFDSILPIYHSELADFNNHWLLALAICAVGCQYTETIELSRCIIPMHEFLWRGLAMELHVANLTQVELPLIQAMILNQITMLYYGPKKLCQLAKARTGTLIELAHSMSLLAPTCKPDWAQGNNEALIERDWKRWLHDETSRRLGYAIWLLDSMAAYHFGCRPLLSLESAQASLPNERLWQSQSFEEWSNLTVQCKPNPPLPSAVQDIFQQKAVKSDLGEFSRIILLHGVYYEVLRVKEYLQRPLSAWIPSAQKTHQDTTASRAPGPENQVALARWRNAALDCVDVLHWDANGTIAHLAGEEHSTVFHLHFSRVVLLTPYEKIRTLTLSITSMAQKQTYRKSPTREEALDAEREVLAWVQKDEHKARLAMIHCGCLFWHVRRYSRKAFYEPTSVLLATLALWAYSCYVSRDQGVEYQKRPENLRQLHNETSVSGNSNTRGQSMGPEAMTNTSPESTSTTSLSTITTVAEAAAAMSESSYPIPTSIQLDRPCDDEMVQVFVRSGRPSAMRAYITGVGDILGPKGPARILAEGGKILCAVSAAWGRTNEYVSLLAALERVMIERTNENS